MCETNREGAEREMKCYVAAREVAIEMCSSYTHCGSRRLGSTDQSLTQSMMRLVLPVLAIETGNGDESDDCVRREGPRQMSIEC